VLIIKGKEISAGGYQPFAYISDNPSDKSMVMLSAAQQLAASQIIFGVAPDEVVLEVGGKNLEATPFTPMFNSLMTRLHDKFAYRITTRLINDMGNIGIKSAKGTSGLYSMGSEIVQIDCSTINYIYG